MTPTALTLPADRLICCQRATVARAGTMKTIDRYLLREFLKPLGYCLAAFTLLAVVYDLFDRLHRFLDARTPLWMVARFYASLVALNLPFLLPASLLLAGLYVFWQLGRANEITAIRTSGVSFARVLVPFLGVGLVASLASLVVQEMVAPEAAQWSRAATDARFKPAAVSRLHRNRVYFNTADAREWIIGTLDLDHPDRLLDVSVKQERPDGTRQIEYHAPRADYLDGVWWFYGLQTQRFTTEDHPIGAPAPAQPDTNRIAALPDFTETPRAFASSVKDWEFLSTREIKDYLAAHRHLSYEDRVRRRVDKHVRLALPWASLVIVLFAVPVGIRGGRQDVIAAVLLSVGLFLGFYALGEAGKFMAKREWLWPWLGAWLSHIVCVVTGAVMVWRTR